MDQRIEIFIGPARNLVMKHVVHVLNLGKRNLHSMKRLAQSFDTEIRFHPAIAPPSYQDQTYHLPFSSTRNRRLEIKSRRRVAKRNMVEMPAIATVALGGEELLVVSRSTLYTWAAGPDSVASSRPQKGARNQARNQRVVYSTV